MQPYMLEVYPPDRSDVVQASFMSDRPFLPISKGDVLDPAVWGDDGKDISPDLLEVVRVEHLVWSSGGEAFHKMMLRTRRVRR